MSIDSNAIFSTTSCIPTTSNHHNKTLGSNDNLNNRGYTTNQDDTFINVLNTLAGTIKDITESPYFPKMAFKKIPSSKNNLSLTQLNTGSFF